MSYPLFRHLPALALLPRASLGDFPSPVAQVALDGAEPLWVKRDDLDGPMMGGNKLRALEFLLGGVGAGDLVLTLGGEGSTHVLATAVHAARLGGRTRAVRWRHEMNPVAREVSRRIDALCEQAPILPPPLAILRLLRWRLGGRLAGRPTHFVPFGGSAPLGILGHVNAALELADQVAEGALPAPGQVVVALGSGGTAAGLALGFALAGLRTEVVGARVGPRFAVTRGRVLRLAHATARLVHRLTGVALPPPATVRVTHGVYGGAYGRTLPAGTVAALLLQQTLGARLDDSYAAKACAEALTLARAANTPGPTLFWLTFDGRWLENIGDS